MPQSLWHGLTNQETRTMETRGHRTFPHTRTVTGWRRLLSGFESRQQSNDWHLRQDVSRPSRQTHVDTDSVCVTVTRHRQETKESSWSEWCNTVLTQHGQQLWSSAIPWSQITKQSHWEWMSLGGLGPSDHSPDNHWDKKTEEKADGQTGKLEPDWQAWLKTLVVVTSGNPGNPTDRKWETFLTDTVTQEFDRQGREDSDDGRRTVTASSRRMTQRTGPSTDT